MYFFFLQHGRKRKAEEDLNIQEFSIKDKKMKKEILLKERELRHLRRAHKRVCQELKTKLNMQLQGEIPTIDLTIDEDEQAVELFNPNPAIIQPATVNVSVFFLRIF